MDGPFDAPPDHPWTRVSPRLARMRPTLLLVVGIPVVVACSVPVAGTSGAGAAAIGVAGVVLLVAGWISVGRNLRSWGYAERSDDLVITHGALFKTLCVVPYGRMQLVDVEAGPIERSFGLVHVKLHTAAATTDAKVCGLAPATASALRDRLTQLGEAHNRLVEALPSATLVSVPGVDHFAIPSSMGIIDATLGFLGFP